MIHQLTAILMVAILAISCNQQEQPAEPQQPTPAVVTMVQEGAAYRLLVNGQPFFAAGAGCEFGDIAALGAHGAKAMRTWRTENGQQSGREVLDAAQAAGLMVMMGLDVAKERHGADYNDTAFVAAQLQQLRAEVEALKDHPALLGWGIGNELNLAAENLKVWDAVDGIAAMIKEVDPNHVTTTMLAGIGAREVSYIAEHCPHLDFISIQMYGDIINLQQRIAEAGYDGPYMVTEWGATGHWEMPETVWGAPIEQTSAEKAAGIMERYEKALAVDTNRLLGYFVFLWGQKQERTPTWYGLFTEAGEETEAIDVMHYLWNGAWPDNRSPQVSDPLLNGLTRFENVTVGTGSELTLTFAASDPDGDELQYRLEVMEESTDLKLGGDKEERPPVVEVTILSEQMGNIAFNAPATAGAYRVFVYITDGHNHVATFNIPFLVK